MNLLEKIEYRKNQKVAELLEMEKANEDYIKSLECINDSYFDLNANFCNGKEEYVNE